MGRVFVVIALALASRPGYGQTVLFDSNGFEAPGYTLGDLRGQNGWQTYSYIFNPSNPNSYFQVQNSLAAGGAGQAVRVRGGSHAGTPTAALTEDWAWPALNYTPASGQLVRIQSDIARSAPHSPSESRSYGIEVFSSTATTTRYGLQNVNGTLRPYVVAPYDSATGQFSSTGAPTAVTLGGAVAANTFVNFDARLDYASKTLRLFVDGIDVGPDIPFMDPTATALADADFFVYSASATSDWGYLDNYKISVVPVPEPLCGGLLVACLLIVARRRCPVAGTRPGSALA